MKRRVRSSPAPAGRAERRHLVFLHPAGTSRRRTGCRCWRSTASTSGSRPSSASWRSSSANRIPPSPSKFLSDNRCHRTRRHLQDATMNPSSTTLHMLREKQNIFRRYFMVCRETLGNLLVRVLLGLLHHTAGVAGRGATSCWQVERDAGGWRNFSEFQFVAQSAGRGRKG